MVIKQEDLDISNFTIEEVEGNENFKKAWFNYKGKLPIIEVEGMFKTYVNMFDGKKVYSLGIDIYETAFDFRELQKKLSKLVGERFSSKPESFKLMNKTMKGRLNIYFRVVTNSFGTLQSIFNEERNYRMKFEDTTYAPFYGKCRIIISYTFKGKTKGIKISAESIVRLRTDDGKTSSMIKFYMGL